MSKIERICKHCGKVDLVYPVYAQRPYCSHACYVAHRSAWLDGRETWAEHELALLREQYPTAALTELSRTLSRTQKAIHAKAEALGIRRQGVRASVTAEGKLSYVRYRVNERFFDRWSPEMAYVLGFILADGCVTTDGLVKINIADKLLLYSIRDSMQSTHPIREHWDKLSTKPLYDLAIRRKALAHSLMRRGITPAKTYIAQWPDSPPEMFPHVVRGYFDGDGSVAYHNGNSYSARIEASFSSASRILLEQLSVHLEDHDIRTRLEARTDYEHNYKLRLGSHASLALSRLMYCDAATIWLGRKYITFRRYIREVSHRGIKSALDQ